MIFQYHTKVNDYITTFLPEITLNLTPNWQTCEPCIWVLILSAVQMYSLRLWAMANGLDG